MKLIEDPADAPQRLLHSLRVLALVAEEQLALFQPHCVACLVRLTFQYWKQDFSASPFATALTSQQELALRKVEEASEAVWKEQNFECNNNRFVCESASMEQLRQTAAKALKAFGWVSGPPEPRYVPGTEEFAANHRERMSRQKQERRQSRRMEPTVCRYHAATMALHQHPLERNRAVASQIARWEKKHGLKLPAAVSEWHQLEGGDLWERLRPRDRAHRLDEVQPQRPATVREIGDTESFFRFWDPSDEDMEVVEFADDFRYLTVFADTDVGTPCLVRIDGSDDPPAFVLPDGAESLVMASPSYSALMFDLLADALFAHREGCEVREGYYRLPTESELSGLLKRYASGPVITGGWYGWHYRFFSPQVLVACGICPYADKPTWTVRACGNQSINELLATLPVRGLRQKLA